MRDLTNNSVIVSAVLKSYDLPESGDEYVMLSVVSSFMARRIVSALQVKMGHEMSGYVFNARAATEEYAHERTDDFTVLVTIGSATQS